MLRRQKVRETQVVVVNLDETDEKALNVALNNPAIAGTFSDKLEDLLAEIKTANATIFTDLRLDALLAQAGPMEQLAADADDPEDIPPLPSVPITQPGDLWELGNHRLICGDSSDPATVARLLDGRRIDICVTSPPYASQRKYDESTSFRPIAPDAYVAWFEPFAIEIRDNLAPGGSFFLNIKENADDGELVTYVMELVLDLKKRLGFRYVEQFAWTHGGTPKAVQQRFKNAFEREDGKLDEFLAKRFGKRAASVIQATHVAEEGRPIENLWDATVGATAYARNIAWQDERVAIERKAGEILDLAST